MVDLEATLKRLSLEQKVGQLFLQNFVGKSDVTQDIRDLAASGLLGGVLFFSGSNVEDLEQLRGLTDLIQELSANGPHGLPSLIALDQEGGQLSALHRGVPVFPGNMAIGMADDVELTRNYGAYSASELRYAGINLDFAPVLDVAHEVKNGVHQPDNRMISAETEVVARHGAALVESIQSAGVMACAKHFPGMRIAEKDTHHQMDHIDYDRKIMEEVYWPPFQAAIDAGVGAVMTHHGVYTSFDDKPASLSKTVLSILRDEMGFAGLIVTDDLIMKAVNDAYPCEIACEMAINAGVDQIVITGGGEWLIRAIADRVRNGSIEENTIDEAVRRVLQAKNRFASGPRPEKAPDQAVGHDISLNLARKAVTIVKDPQSVLPLKPRPRDKVGVILANPARLVMSDTVNFYDISLKAEIESAGYVPYVKEMIMPWNPTDEEILSNFDIGFTSDYLVFTTVNAYRFPGQVETLKQIAGLSREEGHRPVIIGVATRSPDDVPILEQYCDVVLSTGGLTVDQIRALGEKLFLPS